MVHSPVVRLVVVSWLGSDGTPVIGGGRGPVSRRATLVEVNHPDVDYALSSVPEGRGWWKKFMNGRLDIDLFDDILVRFYGYPDDGKYLFPARTPLYKNSGWVDRLTKVRTM